MNLWADVAQTFRTIALEDYLGPVLVVSLCTQHLQTWRQESSFVFAGEDVWGDVRG